MMKYLEPLSEGHSIEVFLDDQLIFSSGRHWLNPLFELEDWLKQNPVSDRSRLSVHDSIDGRAAAVLTCRLGIRRVHSDIMSSLAVDYFEKHGVTFSYGRLVEKILCITEDIITDDLSEQEVWELLSKRAGHKTGM